MDIETPENFSLNEWLDELLPEIDGLLKRASVEVSHRPLHATNFFMKHFVHSIEGYDKDDINNPLFAGCLNYSFEWYEDRYGIIRNNPQSNLVGTVFIHEHPYKLSFPYSISIDEGNDEQSALKFPIEIHDDENWEEYVENSPNFKKMEDDTKAKTESDVGDVVSIIRGIFHKCITIKIKEQKYAELATSIPGHINTASNLLSENNGSAINNALWNLHIASEKAIKAILYQQNGSFKQIHDLSKLLKASKLKDLASVEKIVQKLPSGKVVIDKRYEPSDFNNSFEFKETYLSYLSLINLLSDHFENKFLAKNATIYMKRSKYAGAKLSSRNET